MTAPPTTTTDSAKDEPAGSIFHHPNFVLYILSRSVAFVALEMVSISVGWQIYQVTHRALDLGYVGLAQFLPAAGLSLVTGHVADRFDRRRIIIVCYAVYVVLALALFALTRSPATFAGGSGLVATYVLLFLFGTTRAFSNPAGQAFLPTLVPMAQFRTAVAWSSSFWQLASVIGPGLGGMLIGPVGIGGVYLVCAAIYLLSVAFMIAIDHRAPPRARSAASWSTLLAGIAYVQKNKLVLGALSLDLFAVLFGGAASLMPAFASDILFAGPRGFGALRAAPAIGAGVVAVLLAVRPMKRRAGPTMFACVFLFGLATIAFGLSKNLWFSVFALFVTGASDMVSVVVRQTLIQLNTPDEVRGRVGAVNSVFIGASNELGGFESGLTAQWLGLVRAVVVGGIGTCAVVAIWAGVFPQLRQADSLDRPES